MLMLAVIMWITVVTFVIIIIIMKKKLATHS